MFSEAVTSLSEVLTTYGRRDKAVSTADFPASFFVCIRNDHFILLVSIQRSIMAARIILWITIAVFAVCATDSVRKVDNDPVCYKNMSRKESRNISYEVPYSTKWCETLLSLFKSTPDLVTIQKLQHFTTWDKECCSGYGKKTGICECSMGWGGNFCNESLLCFIILPDQVNDSKNEMKEIKNSTDKLVNEWMRHFHECLPECLDQTNISSFVNITQSENRNLFFIPKNFTCNTKQPTEQPTAQLSICQKVWDFMKKHKYELGGGAIGFIALAMLLCICCTLRKKRRTDDTTEDIPLQSKYPDYMKDNSIYYS